MDMDALLGRTTTLVLRRFGSPGAYLVAPDDDGGPDATAILLLGPEIPENAVIGDAIEVFIALDSEGRPIATTRVPKVERDEVAFLEVTACTEFGAFVDWGLAKELLVPFAEQTRDVAPGERHPVCVYVDDSGRLAGTMRVTERLRSRADVKEDEWIEGEAWRNDPAIGLFVILERRFIGLVPASEPHRLSRGERTKFRVSNILPDGKIELSLRGFAHQELENDGERIAALLAEPDAPKLSDKTEAEEIRRTFGLSKKAFKRAVGRLLREGRVTHDPEGFLVLRKAPVRSERK
jgi:hypothetical protein